MSKRDSFLGLLRQYGISEYWCDKFFKPDDEHPNAEILIPSTNAVLGEAIADLYNDYEDEDKCLLVIRQADKGTELFNMRVEGKERRVV